MAQSNQTVLEPWRAVSEAASRTTEPAWLTALEVANDQERDSASSSVGRASTPLRMASPSCGHDGHLLAAVRVGDVDGDSGGDEHAEAHHQDDREHGVPPEVSRSGHRRTVASNMTHGRRRHASTAATGASTWRPHPCGRRARAAGTTASRIDVGHRHDRPVAGAVRVVDVDVHEAPLGRRLVGGSLEEADAVDDRAGADLVDHQTHLDRLGEADLAEVAAATSRRRRRSAAAPGRRRRSPRRGGR